MIQIRNVNLLGDTLYTLKPIAELHMQRPEEEIRIGVGGGFAAQMVRKQFGGMLEVVDAGDLRGDVIDLSAGDAARAVEDMMRTDCDLRPHISEGFAEILGVDTSGWNGNIAPLTGWWSLGRRGPLAKGYAIIAPFSKSCSRHTGRRPNKTPDLDKWNGVIRWMRDERGLTPYVLVAPGEEWTGATCSQIEAVTLDTLANMMAFSDLVISVDNGIGHVASAVGARTLILWPPMSAIYFIAPIFNPKTRLLLMRPDRIQTHQLQALVKQAATDPVFSIM